MVRILADDWHVLTGSYVLDALPDFERAEFERHLQHCPSCGAEVRGLRETAARLAMARAVQPPPGMQHRVLAGAVRWSSLGSRSPGDTRSCAPRPPSSAAGARLRTAHRRGQGPLAH